MGKVAGRNTGDEGLAEQKRPLLKQLGILGLRIATDGRFAAPKSLYAKIAGVSLSEAPTSC
jgi:hypothetical protein